MFARHHVSLLRVRTMLTDETAAAAGGKYADKVNEQIAQYAEMLDLQQLPSTFHYWAAHHLTPGFQHVFGPVDMFDFYAEPFFESAGKSVRPRFLSIGCGDGVVEIQVAQKLLAKGLSDFEFVCADLSPVLLERFAAAVDPKMRKLFDLRTVDLNTMDAEIAGEFDGVMASHSLHHLVELERIFTWVKRVLKPNCVFAINDMIGRNGHMRWPETGIFVRMIWPLLSEKQRYNVQLKKLYEDFEDHDCSTFGFEGIRAQDILPLLVRTFQPKRFFAAGGVVDPFIDRGFGHGFDLTEDKDKKLVEFICELNDALLDSGQIKPTLMLAHLVNEPVEQKFFRTRSAVACLRNPMIDPAWTTAYPAVVVGL